VPHLSISLIVTFIPSGKDYRVNLHIKLNASSFAYSSVNANIFDTAFMQDSIMN